MTGKLIRIDFITRKYVQEHPDTIFMFGDNMSRKGLGGQAAAMRGEPNTIGIPTKWFPSKQENAYFTNADWNDISVKEAIVSGFDTIEQAMLQGCDVVIPSDGIGTGLAQLKKRAPIVFAYINLRIERLENGI